MKCSGPIICAGRHRARLSGAWANVSAKSSLLSRKDGCGASAHPCSPPARTAVGVSGGAQEDASRPDSWQHKEVSFMRVIQAKSTLLASCQQSQLYWQIYCARTPLSPPPSLLLPLPMSLLYTPSVDNS
jgi:hypothetical protein